MNTKTGEQYVGLGMNTVMTHKAYGEHAGEALNAVRGEALRLERLLSCFIAGSDISRVNKAAGCGCERVSKDTYEVLSHAVEYSSCCRGSFDVTIGQLISLWNKCKSCSMPPEEADLAKVLPLVDYKSILLDPYKRTAGLKHIGQSIDLGGIGKGFAGDKFREVFESYGVKSAFTNIGGNVVAIGAKPDGSPWQIGIQHPRQENMLIGAVAVTDKAVVTSGDYQRYFTDINGKRYHHILEAATGYPAKAGLASVTVVAEGSMAADALSTILFIVGIEEGLWILERYSGAEAVFVDTNMEVYVTAGLENYFKAGPGINKKIVNHGEGANLNEKKGDK